MPASGSYFIDRNAAQKAIDLALPMISGAMQSKQAGAGGFLYVIVMDPLLTPATSSFEEAVLHEQPVFGDRQDWDADYAAFARAKARVAWRTGLDGHVVQELRPQLLTARDTVLWGSVVVDGIVVSASGADPWYDEAFAGSVAMILRALAKAGIAEARANGLVLPAD
jgi:hypothetical protein